MSDLTQSNIEKFILSLPNVTVSQPYGDHILTYNRGQTMFALIEANKTPLRLSLKCNQELSQLLRQKYEEVMPGHNLNQTDWNTIVLSGQLKLDEIKDLIRHSYQLADDSDD